jgi:hypothetical protein
MNAIILGALGIPAFISVVLMVTFYESIKDELGSGFRRIRKNVRNQFHPYEAREERDKAEGQVNANRQLKQRSPSDWDLSGGMMGI